ncbi:MAG: thiolase family protein [Acidimicrobiia bacterium]
MSFLAGSAATAYGSHPGRSALELMAGAAADALVDAGLERGDIDGLVCGYSTNFPHIMFSTVFAEYFGITPIYAQALQLGGATGLAMAMAAHHAVAAGAARRVLVVAGDNRLTGQGRDSAVQVLAGVAHPEYEVPLGLTMPGYYALLASRYVYERAGEADLAELAVLMRTNAVTHPGAQFREAITVDDVIASKRVSPPLKLLDCCPVSDGAAAFVVTRDPINDHCLRVLGAGQAHRHMYVTSAPSLLETGAAASSRHALEQAGVELDEIEYLAVYDSFTVTLACLLEEIGLAPAGMAGRFTRDGRFDRDGELPLNTHGGLLSYGHCGVAGAMAHVVEAHRQMTGRAGVRQLNRQPTLTLMHGDGGIMSSHVSLVMETAG